MRAALFVVLSLIAGVSHAQQFVAPLKLHIELSPYGSGCQIRSTIDPADPKDLASVTVTGSWKDGAGNTIAPFSSFFADLDMGGRSTTIGMAMVSCNRLASLDPRSECRRREGSFLSCLVAPLIKRPTR